MFYIRSIVHIPELNQVHMKLVHVRTECLPRDDPPPLPPAAVRVSGLGLHTEDMALLLPQRCVVCVCGVWVGEWCVGGVWV